MHTDGASRGRSAHAAPAVGLHSQAIDYQRFIFVEKVCKTASTAQRRGFSGDARGVSTLLSTACVHEWGKPRAITALRPV